MLEMQIELPLHETTKLSNNCQRILNLLIDAGSRGITLQDMKEHLGWGFDYRSRISELRKKHGYTIDKELVRLRKGVMCKRYILR